MFGPLSEQFGRKRPLMTGTLLLAVFHIPVALAQNIGTLLVGRFLAGVGGAAPLAILGGMLADFWYVSFHCSDSWVADMPRDPVGRGIAICGFAAATFAGPILGLSLQFFWD